MLQSKKRELSHSTSKKRKQLSNQAALFGNLNSGLGGLVLEAWPMTNRKTSVFNLTNDPSKTKQSTIDRSSIDTLPTESILPRAKVNQEYIPGDQKSAQVYKEGKHVQIDKGILKSSSLRNEGMSTQRTGRNSSNLRNEVRVTDEQATRSSAFSYRSQKADQKKDHK